MLPASPVLAAALLLPVVGIVGGIALLMGWLSVTILGTNRNGLLLDAIVAPIVLVVVFAAAITIPWHGSYVEDGWTFNNRLPHPRAWSLGAALVWPVVHEVFRYRRQKTTRHSSARDV